MRISASVAVGVLLTPWLTVGLLAQSPATAGYVREGDRVEQVFRAHRDRLAAFFQELRATIQREAPPADAPALTRQLENPPPPTNAYGYQMLPRIVEIPQPSTPVTTFSYSWPTTEGYVNGEIARLEKARTELARVSIVSTEEKIALLPQLTAQYRELVRNQRTVDQYVQYNRFWQRAIGEDRSRFDQLTQVYNTLKSGNTDAAETIRKVLGTPRTPDFVKIRRESPNRVVLVLRLYTDIEDDVYLAQAKSVMEEAWRAKEAEVSYAVEIDLRKIPRQDLYGSDSSPKDRDRIDLERHVARFPRDGGVLTTGAQFTYGSVGRYVALGSGDLAPRTLAHEFGHILGFPDGYVRGYADLGERGFEILEITAFFDDIMSAPRDGRVQPTHFRMLLESMGK